MDLSGYAIDDLVPPRAVRAVSTDDIATAIADANSSGDAVVLWGGGTRVQIGELARYDCAIDLSGLRGVVEHSPADLVCTVRAGTTLAELGDALAPAGQRWPIEAAHPDRATVGGTIASAAPGPTRLRHQHVRDWVIGCEAVLGDGVRTKAGGRVVKNVTGYDLARLYSGSYGTLAVIVAVNLKLVALDERRLTLRARDPDGARLARLGQELRDAAPLDAIALRTEGDVLALYVRVAGAREAVTRLAHDVRQRGEFQEADESVWIDIMRPPEGPTLARLAVPPGREAEVLAAKFLAYPGTGIVYVAADADALRPLRARCEAMGGALVLERASLGDKQALGVWGTPRGAPGISRALKSRFDPRGVLAPGRLPA